MERISSEVLLLCNAYLLAVLELNRIVTDNGILTQNNTVVIESVVQKKGSKQRVCFWSLSKEEISRKVSFFVCCYGVFY